ncbi:MerR family transcriptional regulator [uncultured Thomasclavelia sp.]|uniref:MerR family transcriptional regulator n=1 Tax=uncultured Thomasclavelia sp. TaxID=3025759 RepID=UPI0025F14D69|nr:MerR family transcriptional regulator [uncultured Thomasclavelia sp.]
MDNKQYMSVGELAKKMNVSVRTLQYYDREKLLSPSYKNEKQRRYYTYKDMVKLHQILSLKSLGFSLSQIKEMLVEIETPSNMVNILQKQSDLMTEKINELVKSLQTIERLKAEVGQMDTVDFKKYADIIVNIQMDNDYYWLIKHFDEQTLDYIREKFDQKSGIDFLKRFNLLNERIYQLYQSNISPLDQQVINLAKDYWSLIIEFTSGDMSLLPQLMKLASASDDNEHLQKINQVSEYLVPALETYFAQIKIDPFENINENNNDSE